MYIYRYTYMGTSTADRYARVRVSTVLLKYEVGEVPRDMHVSLYHHLPVYPYRMGRWEELERKDGWVGWCVFGDKTAGLGWGLICCLGGCLGMYV